MCRALLYTYLICKQWPQQFGILYHFDQLDSHRSHGTLSMLCVWCNMGIHHGSNHFVENSPSVMGYGHLCQTEPFCQPHPTCHSVTAMSNWSKWYSNAETVPLWRPLVAMIYVSQGRMGIDWAYRVVHVLVMYLENLLSDEAVTKDGWWELQSKQN